MHTFVGPFASPAAWAREGFAPSWYRDEQEAQEDAGTPRVCHSVDSQTSLSCFHRAHVGELPIIQGSKSTCELGDGLNLAGYGR